MKFSTFSLSLALCLASLLTGAVQAHTLPDGHTIKGQYIPSPDGRLYFEKEGSGPVLVLVAGGPGSSHMSFHPLFSQLAKSYTLIYLDNIGRGQSDRLADLSRHTVQRDADDIEILRKFLKVDKISLLGQSYGGMPAIDYAIRYPQNVNKVVSCSSPGSGPLWQIGLDAEKVFFEQHYPEIAVKIEALKTSGHDQEKIQKEIEILMEELPDRSWHHPERKANKMKRNFDYDKLNIKLNLAMTDDGQPFQLGGSIRNYNPLPDYNKIQAKSFICGGRFDYGLPPVITKKIYDSMPSGRSQMFLFEDSGHRPWDEEPALYLQKVKQFLDE